MEVGKSRSTSGEVLHFMVFPSTGVPFEMSVTVRVIDPEYCTVGADGVTVNWVGKSCASVVIK